MTSENILKRIKERIASLDASKKEIQGKTSRIDVDSFRIMMLDARRHELEALLDEIELAEKVEIIEETIEW